MNSEKTRRIAGWIVSGLLGSLFIASAAAKFASPPQVVEQFKELGLGGKIYLIGTGEVVSALLFLIPVTLPLGTLLLSAYMGGAILAHMTHGEPYVAQSVILLAVWLAAFLRRPQMFLDTRAPLRPDLPASPA